MRCAGRATLCRSRNHWGQGMITSFLAFVGISAMAIMTPGPDTAISVRNTLLGGHLAGLATAVGVSAGLMTWALAASFGLIALLVASEPLFLAIKYAGTAYLVYLGLHALIGAWRGGGDTAIAVGPTVARLRPGKALLQGFLSDLGNPKIAVFFASLLPQFAAPGEGMFVTLMLLGATFSAMTLLWLSVYVLVVARMGEVLRRPRVRRWMESIAGTVLVALGIRLAAEKA